MGSHSSQDFLFLYCHLPDGAGGFVVEADHAVPAESLYLAFVDKGSVSDIHAIRHSPRALMREILIVLYLICLDCAILIRESDSHGDHGAVLIMLAYDIYKLLIVSFFHAEPPLLLLIMWIYIVEHLFDYVKGLFVMLVFVDQVAETLNDLIICEMSELCFYYRFLRLYRCESGILLFFIGIYIFIIHTSIIKMGSGLLPDYLISMFHRNVRLRLSHPLSDDSFGYLPSA